VTPSWLETLQRLLPEESRRRAFRAIALARALPYPRNVTFLIFADDDEEPSWILRCHRNASTAAREAMVLEEMQRRGYLTGWRKGEILPLRWDSVDRQAREVRLRTSKNGQGRVLPLDGDPWNLIERRWTARTVQKKDGTTKLSEFVFHRNGQQVVEFRREWKEACGKAHLVGRIFHDFRRTAVAT
jgi:integrase